jgi:hypothetical protein
LRKKQFDGFAALSAYALTAFIQSRKMNTEVVIFVSYSYLVFFKIHYNTNAYTGF